MELIGKGLFALVARIAPFVARWFYSQQKLNEHIKIRVRGDGDGVVFNCGEMPYARACLIVTNLSPVQIEFDRIFGEIFHGSQLAPFYNLHRHVIQASGEKEIFIEISLNSDHAMFLRRNRVGRYQTSINLSAFVVSSLHSYELPRRQLHAGNVEFQNCPP